MYMKRVQDRNNLTDHRKRSKSGETNDYSQFKKNYLTDIFDISATAAAEAATLLGRLIMFKQ